MTSLLLLALSVIEFGSIYTFSGEILALGGAKFEKWAPLWSACSAVDYLVQVW